jgi:hypothetical protein
MPVVVIIGQVSLDHELVRARTLHLLEVKISESRDGNCNYDALAVIFCG